MLLYKKDPPYNKKEYDTYVQKKVSKMTPEQKEQWYNLQNNIAHRKSLQQAKKELMVEDPNYVPQENIPKLNEDDYKKITFNNMQKVYEHPLGQPGMLLPGAAIEDIVLNGTLKIAPKIATAIRQGRASKYIGKAMSDMQINNRVISNVPRAKNIHINNANNPLPYMPDEALRRGAARKAIQKTTLYPEKINLVRVDKPPGINIVDGIFEARTGKFKNPHGHMSNRHTTHFAKQMVKDVPMNSWDDTTVAFIDNADNLLKSSKGTALSYDPRDTFFYTKDNFRFGNTTAAITRDKTFYDTAKKQGANIHYVGDLNDKEWRLFIDESVGNKMSTDLDFVKRHRYASDLMREQASRGEKVFHGNLDATHANTSLSFTELIESVDELETATRMLKENAFDFLPPNVRKLELRKLLSSEYYPNLSPEYKKILRDMQNELSSVPIRKRGGIFY